MSNAEETPANFTVIQSTDDWNNFLERVSFWLRQSNIIMFTNLSDFSQILRFKDDMIFIYVILKMNFSRRTSSSVFSQHHFVGSVNEWSRKCQNWLLKRYGLSVNLQHATLLLFQNWRKRWELVAILFGTFTMVIFTDFKIFFIFEFQGSEMQANR